MFTESSLFVEETEIMNRYRLLIDVLIAMFGISAWIGVNGVFIQLPLLVSSAPEGWSLPAYVVVVIQAANVSPICYGLLRKFGKNPCTESTWISGLLVIGSVAMGCLAFFYDVGTYVNGAEHSVVLLILVFATALVGCSSSILFLPYLHNFPAVHLVSFFVGEGLSGLLPSGVALIQGVGESPVCRENEANSTDLPTSATPVPKFSPRVYFLFLFFVLVTSTCAFWGLQCVLRARNKVISNLENAARDSDRLYDRSPSTERRFAEKISEANDAIDSEPTASRSYADNCRYYLYVLMGLICFGGNGFLPGVQSYSCLPYGNLAYHLTVTLANLSNPVACILGLWLPPPGPRGITLVTVFAALAAAHVTWLAFLSPTPPLRDATLGVVFVVSSWIILTGFVTYAKLLITGIFRREPSPKALFYLGVVTQIGSATGAICSFVLINYSNVLVPYTGGCVNSQG